MTTLEQKIQRSAERLSLLIGPLHAPRSIVDNELRLLVQATAGLVGPDRVRRWLDDLMAREMAVFHDPKRPCRHCKGIGFLFGLGEDAQCPQCSEVGAV